MDVHLLVGTFAKKANAASGIYRYIVHFFVTKMAVKSNGCAVTGERELLSWRFSRVNTEIVVLHRLFNGNEIDSFILLLF